MSQGRERFKYSVFAGAMILLNSCSGGGTDSCGVSGRDSLHSPKPALSGLWHESCALSPGMQYKDVATYYPEANSFAVQATRFVVNGKEIMMYDFSNQNIDINQLHLLLGFLSTQQALQIEDFGKKYTPTPDMKLRVKHRGTSPAIIFLADERLPVPAIVGDLDEILMPGVTIFGEDYGSAVTYLRIPNFEKYRNSIPKKVREDKDDHVYNDENTFKTYLLATELCNLMITVGYTDQQDQRIIDLNRLDPQEAYCGGLGKALALRAKHTYESYLQQMGEGIVVVSGQVDKFPILSRQEYEGLPEIDLFPNRT